MLVINEEQKENLSGFFLYMWNYNHNKEDPYYRRETNDFSFYAEKLDKLNISWRIQNIISFAADTKDNGYIYFSTLLKKLNIEVTKD